MKKQAKKPKFIVIALGGSILFPRLFNEGGLNIPFLKELRKFFLDQVKKGKRFVIIVGGGKACRLYQQAAREVANSRKVDQDWLGISVTKTNALLMINVLREVAYPQVIDHEPSKKEINGILKSNKKIVVVSGWQPGWSTDYDAVKCAQIFGASEVINASDNAYVYDKDPKIYPDAVPIKTIAWTDYLKLIPAEWTPGMSSPVDPAAARMAKKSGLTVKRLKGTDLGNLLKAINGEEFEGSTISGK